MDRDKSDNERELTSTMGNVLSVSIKDEKNDTSGSDATPTSSTDANTTTTSSQIVSDDPISSTSSDVVELNKSKTLETNMQSSIEISQTSVDPETDLLEMSISSGPRERITEDVEDLVHDLESLLGESTDSFNIPLRRKEDRKSPTEKEKLKTPKTPLEDNVLSSEDPSSNKVNEAVQNSNIEDITKDISNSVVTEEVTDTIEENKEETEPNIIIEDNYQEISENVSSCGDKEFPVQTLESETNLDNKNEAENQENVQHDTVTNEAETAVKDSKILEECTIEEIENNVITDESVDIEPEEINAEPIVEEADDITEIEDTTTVNKDEDQIQADEDEVVITEIEPQETILEASVNDEILEATAEKTEEISVVCAEESILEGDKTETEHKEQEISDQEVIETEEVDESAADNCANNPEVLDENKEDNSSEIENIVHSEPPTEVVECEEAPEVSQESVVEAETKLEEVVAPENVEIEVATAEEETVNEEEVGNRETPEEIVECSETTELETTTCEVHSTDLKGEEADKLDETGEVNIPQSSETKTEPEGISSEPVESEIIPPDTVNQSIESNCDANESVAEVCAESEIVKTPITDDDSSMVTEVYNTVNETVETVEEEETPQNVSVTEEDIKTAVTNSDQIAVAETTELVSHEPQNSSVEVVQSEVEGTDLISTQQTDQSKDLVTELNFSNDVDAKEVAEAALQELTQTFDENEVDLQPEVLPEIDADSQQSKLVENDLLIVNCDYTKIQTTAVEETCLNQVDKECEPSASSAVVSTYSYSELTAEVIEPTDENSKLPITALEEVVAEEQDLGWVENVLPKDEDETEDRDVENASNIQDLEMLDDDTKIMQPERECVPFFSPVADSDSEDTVPTLVLEPDEVNLSPEQSNVEKDTNEIDELAVHSTNDTDIPDKLPGIEEILNDQGNVDDVVENIDMQENLETILAVASLQNTESANLVEPEPEPEPEISDKERREMEALRKAVESITDIPTTEYRVVEDLTEFQEQPLQQVIPEVEPEPEPESIDGLVQISAPDTKKELEETVPPEQQIDSENKLADAEASVMESVTKVEQTIVETEETLQTLPDTSEDKISAIEKIQEAIAVLPDSSQNVAVNEETKLTEMPREKESKHSKANERPKRHKKSSADNKFEELSINVDVPEREKLYSPKVTIKPIKVPDEEVSTTSNSDSEIGKGSLKMTITKQSDKMHSVLKICESDNSELTQEQDEPIPKLIIKPKMQQVEQQHSPKMSTRSSKQMYSPTSSTQRSGSPRITIKPVVKPDKESVSPLKIKIKPEEVSKRHSPKLTIKPVTKPEEECRENIQSPRKVTIKPVVKTSDDLEQVASPRITIKPIPKPDSEKESVSITPRLNIKPIKKQDDEDLDVDRERSSPKITIKPLIKPQDVDPQLGEADDAAKGRIVLKINKGNLPTPTKESKKREHPPDDEKSEKLAKITVKFSKGGGHAHIVQQTEESNKRSYEEQPSPEKYKKQKTENESPVLTRSKHKDVLEFTSDVSRTKQSELHVVETRSKHHPICDTPRSKQRETPETSQCESIRSKQGLTASPRSRANNDSIDDVRIIEAKLNSPIVISEDSRSQDSGSCVIVENPKDPLAGLPTYDITMKSVSENSPVVPESVSSTPIVPATPTPRKRGRPRKVPIVVREDFKEQEEPKPEPPKKEEPPLLHESGRPKRSCRGQNVRATLGIKPRKPRGPGRGRGSKRGMGTRVLPSKPEELSK